MSYQRQQNASYQQSYQPQSHHRDPSASSSHPAPPPSPSGSFHVQALYAYSGVDTSSLSFRQGDVIEVLSTLASGWWDGVLCDQKVRGWFPSNYVQRISEEEAAWAREQMQGFWEGGDDTGTRGEGRAQDDNGDYDGGNQTIEDLMAENLTSFSSGADIFSEIAAAAQIDSSNRDTLDFDDEGARRAVRLSLTSESSGDEDLWVPKVTHGGTVFWLNTRTSETSRDMPIDGMGDGVQIPLDEFPPDEEDSRASLGAATTSHDHDWTTKLTPDGSAVYYFNEVTGARSWDPPPSRPAVASSSALPRSEQLNQTLGLGLGFPKSFLSAGDRASTGGASLLSARTERTWGPRDNDGGSVGKAETLRRLSTYSDDSVLDADFDGGARDRKGKEKAVEEPAKPPSPVKEKRRSRQKAHKAVSTAELLEPPPPPLINDLESLVTTALQDLINGAGMGGMPRGDAVDAQVERDSLAALADGVVAAVRTLLHAVGVLEQVVTVPLSQSATTETSSVATRVPTLPVAAQLELRPATRRVTSTLSKLVLTVRSAWGLLETLDIDQILDVEDTPGDEDEMAQRELERDLILSNWAQVREYRFENETKLRSEVLAGARDVQTYVLAFLSEFERVVGESTKSVGGPPLPRALLRAPKALQGSLRTNAAALLLPGGGFGGNWRGNGFVTLPTPSSSPLLPVGGPGPSTISYAYPSKAITLDVTASLQQGSVALLEEAASLRALVDSLASASPADPTPSEPPAVRPRSGSASSLASIASRLSLSMGRNPTSRTSDSAEAPTATQLLQRTGMLQCQIAAFLTKVEDIDVAASVDFELSGESQSRPGSRRDDFVSASGSVSTSAGESLKESDVESILDPPATEYRRSVQEARPLFAELEVRKQALYDISPALLSALQELYMAPAGPGAFPNDPPIAGPQPLSTSPLAFFVSPTRVEFGPDTVLEVIADLVTAVSGICSTLNSLGAIAEIQSTAPQDLRQTNMAFRSSLFNVHTSPSSSSSHADSRMNGNALASLMGVYKPALSPSSSRASLARTDDESAEVSSHSRDSVDSDFFFSKGAAGTSPTSSMGLSSKTAKLFSAAGTWARPSSGSSNGSRDHMRMDSDAGQPTPPLVSPSKKKDLAKILGKDAPRTLLGANPSGPESSWLGQSTSDQLPPWLEPDYGPDEVSFNLDRQVRGGTLRALVIAATSHEGRVDANYLSAFLMTFRTFCTAHELLRLLSERYLLAPPPQLNPDELKVWKARKQAPIQARVANVLKSWVREHMDHEEIDQDLLRGIAEFAQKQMGKGSAQTIQITNLVEDRLRGNTISKRGNLAPGSIPPSIIPRNFRRLKFIDIDPLEIARQLTLKDCALFSQITVQECLGKAWPKQFGSDAPHISLMIDLSNAITRWVTETILAENDLKKRANTIKHFITIAEKCSDLHNFSTLIHIIAGLNSTPIHRLRRTWETVNAKSMASLKGLNAIMRPDKNYKVYRETLRNVTPPCVPFLGVYLTDWTFIGDGNPDMLREKPHQINFNKRQKASELILMIKLHQSTTYNLSAVPQIRQLIDDQLFPVGSNPATDDQRLYEISLSREPRERDDEKIARLLSESGFL